ncbi:hypothetical protein FGO68_gene4963 [Halteria grandinella]|uniref:Uncharacterized protein n=1 Tax=Halteria grandinella TaxID=5974 RepID=A0A8J8NNM9_HALGN|nr:hypothetical protein FGO68_gene4963 [Halteria grandinella]
MNVKQRKLYYSTVKNNKDQNQKEGCHDLICYQQLALILSERVVIHVSCLIKVNPVQFQNVFFEVSNCLRIYNYSKASINDLKNDLHSLQIFLHVHIVIIPVLVTVIAQSYRAHHDLEARESNEPRLQKQILPDLLLEDDAPADCIDADCYVEEDYAGLPHELSIAFQVARLHFPLIITEVEHHIVYGYRQDEHIRQQRYPQKDQRSQSVWVLCLVIPELIRVPNGVPGYKGQEQSLEEHQNDVGNIQGCTQICIISHSNIKDIISDIP